MIALAAMVFCLADGAEAKLLVNRVAPGIYSIFARVGGPNVGVIDGRRGVLLIDTFADTAEMATLLTEFLPEVTNKPVTQVILTGPHPDHAAGLAFLPDSIEIYSTPETRGRLEKAGAANPPNRAIDGRLTLYLGDHVLDAVREEPGARPGNLTVVERNNRVIFTGDLCAIKTMPDLAEADLPRWLAILDRFERNIIQHNQFIPGYGPPGLHTDVGEFREYLEELSEKIQRELERGRGVDELKRKLKIRRARQWTGFDERREANIESVYKFFESRKTAPQR